MNKNYWNVREVAEYFGIGVATVWRMSRDGLMPPPVKITPSTTRWRMQDLRAWEAAGFPMWRGMPEVEHV